MDLYRLLIGINSLLKWLYLSLAGVALWTEYRPANQKITGSIPSQGTCLGCEPGPQMGGMWEAIDYQCFSFSLPSPRSKNK